jgi:L-fucose isomerase-like protein
MIKPKVGFIVYGVHKDGLLDPNGQLWIDEKIIENAKKALIAQGMELVCHDVVVATKKEAYDALKPMRDDDSISAVVLFSGTWVWASNMVAAIRDFAKTGKGLLIWTHNGSQGWRPVGGFVLHGGLLEIGIPHKFVYGAADDAKEVSKIAAFLRGAHLKNMLNGATCGAFGGRGMGQTCGVADPSQWMRVFGVDIDSRDTTQLIARAESFTDADIDAMKPVFEKLFDTVPERNPVNDRSIRLYLALKALVTEEGFDFYGIQGFPGMGDDYSAACFAQSMMLGDGVPTMTLCDFNSALTIFLLTHLSDSPVYYGDLQHFDKKTREMKIICDGACPPQLAAPGTKATFAGHGIPTEGKAGGLSVNVTCKPGTGVLARLGRVNGEFVMILAKCDVFVPDPAELKKRRLECGIPFWPHAFATMHCDMDKLVEHWNNEYGILGYGDHLYDAIAAFCEQTGIEVILP